MVKGTRNPVAKCDCSKIKDFRVHKVASWKKNVLVASFNWWALQKPIKILRIVFAPNINEKVHLFLSSSLRSDKKAGGDKSRNHKKVSIQDLTNDGPFSGSVCSCIHQRFPGRFQRCANYSLTDFAPRNLKKFSIFSQSARTLHCSPFCVWELVEGTMKDQCCTAQMVTKKTVLRMHLLSLRTMEQANGLLAALGHYAA